jgi:ribosomal protein S18 acetylase RimI-like enzyme
MDSGYNMRRARGADRDALVAVTLQATREIEGGDRDIEAVTRGARSALGDSSVATYWVAESADGAVVASTSVVTEWSDFNGDFYWWIQSLFITPEHRGGGLVGLILDHLTDAARAASALGLRLYVHNSNQRALAAYRRCGFEEAPYTIMTRQLTGGSGQGMTTCNES